MFVDGYYSQEGATVRISAEQGSRFAKEIAGDFNPIHDPNAPRYCVPGDLLFALLLRHYGLSHTMEFRFRGMVGGNAALRFMDLGQERVDLLDPAGRVLVELDRRGETHRAPATLERFIRRYTAFSGRNFPDFLIPLLHRHRVMFNPDRPLVIYDSMAFALHRAPHGELDMELEEATLSVAGRRGEETLHFSIRDDSGALGAGRKSVVIGGLQPLDEARLEAFVDAYLRRRHAAD